jgi:exodeoxyribonuclease V alpha subunit
VAGTGKGDDPRPIALVPFARAESGLANRLRALCHGVEWAPMVARIFGTVDWAAAFGWLADRHGLRLAPEQEAAVRTTLTEPVSILTGGPGTGKTHCLKRSWRSRGPSRCVACWQPRPVARPSGWKTPQPGANRSQKPLKADLIVVDEVSMLDALLANQLVRSPLPGVHLLLVGDPDQLPSVGAGDVLADLLRSGHFPVTTLTHIFRQGAAPASPATLGG